MSLKVSMHLVFLRVVDVCSSYVCLCARSESLCYGSQVRTSTGTQATDMGVRLSFLGPFLSLSFIVSHTLNFIVCMSSIHTSCCGQRSAHRHVHAHVNCLCLVCWKVCAFSFSLPSPYLFSPRYCVFSTCDHSSLYVSYIERSSFLPYVAPDLRLIFRVCLSHLVCLCLCLCLESFHLSLPPSLPPQLSSHSHSLPIFL